MKRILSLLFVILLSLLCACGELKTDNNTAEPVDIMIDQDYESLLKRYGSPLYACNYKEGASYQFTEGGPWFTFKEASAIPGPGVYTKSDELYFIEPLNSCKCTMIRSTVSVWLGVPAENINNIEDIKKYSGINKFNSEYDYMTDSQLHVAKTDKCTISITEYMGKTDGTSYVTIVSNSVDKLNY